ncbi:hypothetical protein [Aquifex sp.]
MVRLGHLIILIIFSLILSLGFSKHLVYCVHEDEGSVHVEVVHTDYTMKGDEIHVNVTGEWSYFSDNAFKLFSFFQILLIREETCPDAYPRREFILGKKPKESPLDSVKLLI